MSYNEEQQGSIDLIKLIPNALTMGALCMGLFAVRLATIDNFIGACICILISGVFDTLDGRVARRLNVSSDFGAQLDSFADFFNFGIAPGFLVYFWSMDDFMKIKGIGWMPVLILAICMAIRLSRFNLSLNNEDMENPLNKYFFQGVPAPMAALFVLLPMVMSFEFDWAILSNPMLNIVNTTVFALLAASTIPTPCLKKVKILSKYKSLISLLFGILFVFLLFRTWITITIFSVIYLIMIFVGWFHYYKFSKQLETKTNE